MVVSLGPGQAQREPATCSAGGEVGGEHLQGSSLGRGRGEWLQQLAPGLLRPGGPFSPACCPSRQGGILFFPFPASL